MIPNDLEVPFRADSVAIGTVSVKDAAGFAEGKNLKVTVSAAPFTSDTTDTVMPYTLSAGGGNPFGEADYIFFAGKSDGTLGTAQVSTSSGFEEAGTWHVNFEAEDWDALKPGNYTASITFSADVVENASND